MTKTESRRGIVLLMVLGILALMSVMAIAFVQVSQLERSISRNYMEQTRALLAAESGIDFARSRLLDYHASVPSIEQIRDMEYIPDPTAPDDLRRCEKVSFQTEVSSGSDRNLSSVLSVVDDTVAEGVKLRVEDEGAKINLNDSNSLWNLDSDPYGDTDDFSDDDYDPTQTRLSRMVEILCDVIYREIPPAERPLSGNISNALFDVSPDNALSRPNLPGGQFTNMEQVYTALRVGDATHTPPLDSDELWDMFKAHVTLWSWADDKVLKPNFKLQISTPSATGMSGYPLPDPKVIPTAFLDPFEPGDVGRTWTQEPPRNWERDLFLWADWQTTEFELESRCPVNPNLAGRDLLEALIAPVQGWYLREGPGDCSSIEPRSRRLQMAVAYQYFWDDFRNEEMTGRIRSEDLKVDKTFKDSSTVRFGQAFQTPDLSDILVPENPAAPLPRMSAKPFPEAAADYLYARIHEGMDWNGNGTVEGGTESPNSLETFEELEYVLDVMLADFFPDDLGSSDLEIFWQGSDNYWTPQPTHYDTATRTVETFVIPFVCTQRWGVMFGFSAAESYLPAIDFPYWNKHCRDILRDLLLANFNPNSQLNDYNPDKHINRRIDKAQLTQNTTEFIFQAIGPFKVTSLGMAGMNSTAYTESEIEAVMELYVPYRVTTQAQFMDGFTEPQQFARKSVFLDTTWDTTVMSYPEPLVYDGSTGNGKYLLTSHYDGYLMPAQWQIDYRGTTGAMMWVPFDGRLEGHNDLRVNAIMRYVGAPDKYWTWENPPALSGGQANTGDMQWRPHNIPSTDRLTYAAGGSSTVRPGCLLPDGALSDPMRGIAYDTGNIASSNGHTGAVQFWLKPNFDCDNTSRSRSLFDLSRNRNDGSNMANFFRLNFVPHYLYRKAETITLPFSMFGTAQMCSVNSIRLDLVNVVGTYREYSICSPTVTKRFPNQLPEGDMAGSASHTEFNFESHEWSHLVIGWDVNPAKDVEDPANPGTNLRGACANDPSKLYLQINGIDAIDDGPNQAYDSLRAVSGSPATHIHQPFWDKQWIRFGGGGSEGTRNDTGDYTVDDIVTYVAYRPDGTPVMPPGDAEVFRQFGRYYKPDIADPGKQPEVPVFTSAPRDLFQELKWQKNTMEIAAAAWTGYWPKHNLKMNHYAVLNDSPRPLQVNDEEAPDPLVEIYANGTTWTEAYGIHHLSSNPDEWGWEKNVTKTGKNLDPFSVDVCRVERSGRPHWACDMTGTARDEPLDALPFTFAYAGGSRIRNKKLNSPFELQRGDKFSFRVYFNINPENGITPGNVLNEAPVIDDITFFVRSNSILNWKVIK